MARTQIGTTLIEDGSVRRVDINTTLTGSALITKLLVNSPLTISSTGVDSGTGDVTIGLSTANLVTSFNTRVGAVTLSGSDVTTALGFTPISGYTETDTLATVTGRGATTNTSITVGSDLTVQADGSANYTASRLWLKSHNNYRGAGIHMSGVGSTWFAGTPYTDFDGGYVIARTGTADDITSAQYSNALFTVKSTGNVGIGTSSPTVTLNVQNGGSTPKALFQHGTLAHLGVLIGSTGGGFTIEDNNYFAIWHQDYTNRATETGITERLRIATSGNLLVGTSTDSGYKLDVTGTTRISGALTANSFVKSGGTSAQFLKADGSVDSNTYLTSVTNITGNAGTATTLQTARNINGTSFNGSGNITTAVWGNARNLTVGNTAKAVDGSGNVSWTLGEIQAEYQVPNNTLRNNLGDPTVREMAMFHGQFNNKFRFISPTLQEESNDGITWTTSTRASAATLGDMMRGEGEGTSFAAIPTGTIGTYGGYRLTWNVVGTTGYIFLNALYVFNSTNGNNVTIKIEAYHNTTGWTTIVGPLTTSNWPGHAYIPHSNIPYSNNASQYSQVRITFETTHNSNTNSFTIYSIEWVGGYPQGKRNAESWDKDKNVTFPGIVYATGGSSSNWNTAYSWGNHASAGYQSAATAITTSNIGSQSVTYASSSAQSGRLTSEDNRTISPSELTAGSLKFGFTSWANNNSAPYADFLHLRSYTDASGGNDNLVMFRKDAIGMRIWQQAWGSATAYASYVDVWTTGDFSSSTVTNWNTAYTNRITSLTTTGSSGVATLSSNVLNIPNYTLAGLGYSVPTLAQVTTAGNTTTNAITVGGLTVDTDTLFVDATNNRVGIGTATPTDKLHIIDSSNANIFGRITATGTNASAAWVAMNNQNDNVVYRVFGDGVSGSQMGISLVRSASLMANLGGSGKFLLGTYSATDFVMGTGNAEKVRIVNATGNFLIGTTSDNGNKLQVSGTIDGQAYAVNGIAGWTGNIMIPTNPPGMQNIQVDNGIITNVF